MREQRAVYEADRVRLREEHARLEGLQAQLKAERDLLRQDVVAERGTLRSERDHFEAEKRELQKRLSLAQEEVGPGQTTLGATCAFP